MERVSAVFTITGHILRLKRSAAILRKAGVILTRRNTKPFYRADWFELRLAQRNCRERMPSIVRRIVTAAW
jgi:hypothetical protein